MYIISQIESFMIEKYECFLNNYCQNIDIRNIKNKLDNKHNISLYFVVYLNVIFDVLKTHEFNSFFERDFHSFEPFRDPNTSPLSINPDTLAFDSFISALRYLNNSSEIQGKEFIASFVKLFDNFNLKIEIDRTKSKCFMTEKHLNEEDCSLCENTGVIVHEYCYIKNNFMKSYMKVSDEIHKQRALLLRDVFFFIALNFDINITDDFLLKDFKLNQNITNF
jgi:hypothetical protein